MITLYCGHALLILMNQTIGKLDFSFGTLLSLFVAFSCYVVICRLLLHVHFVNKDTNTICIFIGEIGGLFASLTSTTKAPIKSIINHKLFLQNFQSVDISSCCRLPAIQQANPNIQGMHLLQYVVLSESTFVVIISKCNQSSHIYLEFRCASNSKALSKFSGAYCISELFDGKCENVEFSSLLVRIIDTQEVMAFSCGIRCKMLLLCICLELPGKADGHDGCTGGGASVSERRWICVNVSKMEYLCVEHTHGSVLNVLLTAGSIEECLGSCPPDVLKDCKSSELPWIQKSYVGVVEGLVGFSSLWRDSVNPKMYEDGNIKSQVDENKNAKYVMAVCCGTSPADGLFVASSLNGAWSLMQYVQGLCVKERDISFCNAHGSVDVSKNYVIKM